MTGVDPLLLVAGLLLTTLALGYAGVASYAEGVQQQRAALRQGAARRDVGPLGDRLRSVVDQWGRSTRVGRSVNLRVRAAGLEVRLADALLLLLGVVVVAAAVAWFALGPPAALFAVVVVGQGALLLLRWLADRRLERFVAQLPQVARLLANGASAGLSIRRSIQAASTELAEPARTEMIAVSDAMAVGVPLEAALGQLDERLPSRELAVLVRTLVIQVRSGGGVVTALQRMSKTLDERKKLRNEMRSALAATTYVSYLVPLIGLAGVLVATGGDREVLRLYFTTLLGQVALVLSFALLTLAMVLMHRSIRRALSG